MVAPVVRPRDEQARATPLGESKQGTKAGRIMPQSEHVDGRAACRSGKLGSGCAPDAAGVGEYAGDARAAAACTDKRPPSCISDGIHRHELT
jgi:hypothetical protein